MRLEHGTQGARLLGHYARRTLFVAQLHKRCAARDALREIGERAPAGDCRVNESVEPQVDAHQLILVRAMSVAGSRS
jgi:hypothetical protein